DDTGRLWHGNVEVRPGNRVRSAGDLDWVHLEIDAAETLTRVLQPESGADAAAPSLARILAFTETKTVWHTKGLL
ncbi:hypothetical protein QN354_05500, partial [Cryobacterium sp. 5I3]|nr:hypothetical protein [Cryobacterium sp. 5I3]